MKGSIDVVALLEVLEGRIPVYFPALNNEHYLLKRTEFSEQSTYPLFKFDVIVKGRPEPSVVSIIVKFAPVFNDNNEGLTEYNNMRLVQEYLGGSSILGYVKPLEFISDFNALVTEYISHERLSKHVLEKCSYSIVRENNINLKDQLYKSGVWLQKFHDETSQEKIYLKDTSYFSTIDAILGYLAKVNILRDMTNQVLKFIDAFKAESIGMKVPIGRVHGDYGPQNIGIGDDGRIYVFDLQREYGESIYHDITYLITTLETMNPYPKYKMFNRVQAVSLSHDFLQGYKEGSTHANEWDDVAYHLYYLRNLLQRAQKQCQNQNIYGSSSLSSHVKKIIIQNTFASKLNREIKILRNIL